MESELFQVDRLVAYYNEVRPHLAKGRMTPRAAFESRALPRTLDHTYSRELRVRQRPDRSPPRGHDPLQEQAAPHRDGESTQREAGDHAGGRGDRSVSSTSTANCCGNSPSIRAGTTSPEVEARGPLCSATPVHHGPRHHSPAKAII
jgi:hypothetical protein